VAAFASASLLLLAAPPFDLWPLAFVGLIPLYLALRQTRLRRAAGLGWLTGLLINLGGFYWMAPFLKEFAHLSWPVSVGIVVAMCAYQALVFGVWAWACSRLAQRARLSWTFAAPLVIVLAESVIPFLFKYHLAVTLWRAWPLVQVAEVGGPAAVSALIVLTNLVLAEGLLALRQRQIPGLATRLGAATLVVVATAGWLRAAQVSASRQIAPKLQIGLLQPNFGITSIAERELHGNDYIQALREATLLLSQQGADLVIWSESAWPYLFDRLQTAEYPRGHPWELRPGAKGRLLMGALTHQFGGSKVYNSAVLIAENGEVRGIYDKNHLVPFSEYIPLGAEFPEWGERARQQLPDWPEIEPGKTAEPLTDEDLRVAIVICFEDLNPSYVSQIIRQDANLLVSLVSDSWFGDSPGARFHLAVSSLRAVETRRDLVRATNTGVSAIFGATGQIQLEGPLFKTSRDQPLKPTLLRGEVALMNGFALGPYTTRWFPYLCLALLAIGMVIVEIRAPGRRKSG
jgi:apolipoprotein N-acyltransferase